jgi:hypothetical protein
MERNVSETVEMMKLVWARHVFCREKAQPMMALKAAVAGPDALVTEELMFEAGQGVGIMMALAWGLPHNIPFEQRFLDDRLEHYAEQIREGFAKLGANLEDVELPLKTGGTPWAVMREEFEKIQADIDCPCPKCSAQRAKAAGREKTDGPLPNLFEQEKMQRIDEDLKAAFAEVCKKHGVENSYCVSTIREEPQT